MNSKEMDGKKSVQSYIVLKNISFPLLYNKQIQCKEIIKMEREEKGE